MTAYSAWFALPTALKKGEIPKDLATLAKHFGVSVKSLEEAKRRPEMLKAVKDHLHAAAVYGMPDILYNMIEMAAEKGNKEAPKAARFVAEVGEFIRGGGSVNVSQTTVVPMAGEWTDDELRSKVWEIAKRAVPPAREE